MMGRWKIASEIRLWHEFLETMMDDPITDLVFLHVLRLCVFRIKSFMAKLLHVLDGKGSQ